MTSIDLVAKTILDRILELFSIRNSQKLLVQLGTLKATADLTLVISGKNGKKSKNFLDFDRTGRCDHSRIKARVI